MKKKSRQKHYKNAGQDVLGMFITQKKKISFVKSN